MLGTILGALGNLLGVRWLHGTATLDVDFAHAGRNLSVALPADLPERRDHEGSAQHHGAHG
jgi:hypothetical protein